MLKRFGFFEESSPSSALQDLRELQMMGPLDEEELVLQYLSEGTMLFEAGGSAFDRLQGGSIPIGPPDVYSDGEWCWSKDVLYYIRHYHIAVESQFFDWMIRNNWKCPKIVSAEALVQSNWLT
ncbi:hypothetical protein DTL21_23945 [Bremerella cremea]|uniref:Uncharacterized protein n=1 Tax=Blastopirellula marina TaxID=124 RepID=A0A2S8FE43_9BACT|nr:MULTISPECIES: hypothetical protein [Pirellulaceae]PQO30412.1 hypothetical protein C5Y83_23905 [Blastopirellula marina]RCS43764.1 hypothetical protein DTL21_23945 [Bremerella cremea]